MKQLLHLTFFGALRFKLSKETCQLLWMLVNSMLVINLPISCAKSMKMNGWVVKVVNKKGIDCIEEINFDHPDIKSAEPLPSHLPTAVLPLFRPFDVKRGDVIQQNKVRELLLEYAKSRSLEKKVHKGKLPSIELKVEKRCGNKSQKQTGVATGTTLLKSAANCEGTQLLVHGNQVNFIGEHLTNAHGIQKKYIKGLDLGVKEKRRKISNLLCFGRVVE
uniref:Uncharacterized protein n=1 Tax=Ditylenchus dipsaci TaxID=166011 RepID=A0A915EC55_9BILA